MKEIVLGFFKDNKDNLSMTRLLSFILCVGGLVFAYIHPDYEAGYLGIITLGFSGKVVQKKLSEKDGKIQD